MVIKPEREQTVSDPAADDHIGVFFGKQTGIIGWEEPLIGCNQSADKRQPEMTPMGMTAEYQVCILFDIIIDQIRPMGQ